MSTIFQRLGLLTLVLLLSACAGMGQQQVEGPLWVGSWGASPVASTDSAFATAARFENQTLRQVVHGSMGGDALRVRLSNDFGSGDLVIGAASVGLQVEGTELRPGTLRELRFGGEPGITIPPGAFVLSDPVELRSGDFANFVVSVFLPEDTGRATMHSAGLQTSYISDAGDYTQAQSRRGFPVMETTDSVFFLTGVDVLSGRQGASTLVAFGDSITDGTGSTPNFNQRWPNLLGQGLAEEGELTLGIINQGIAGNRLLHDVIGDNAQARFERDVLSWENLGHVVIMVGINDIGFSAIENFPFGDSVDTSEVSADELIAGYRQLIRRARSRGAKVYGATLTPFKGATYFSEAGEDKRQAVNRWIRESGEYDGVIDFDRALRDPQDPEQLREDMHGGDWLHPNDAGYALMAETAESFFAGVLAK